ncbi:MAG TPA: CpXC domain-containing protein [Ktedonobacterales bacterium]
MPRSSTMNFTCDCGNVFAGTMYQTVNVTLEPHLLYRLLAGTLNVAVCPNCGRKYESDLPFIYHDMDRSLFAYVHPNGDATDEERDDLLQRLRKVYDEAVDTSQRILSEERSGEEKRPPVTKLTVRRRSPGEDLKAQLEPNAPPMQVIFGMEALTTLVDSLLEPEERLGRVALSARGKVGEERERIVTIAAQIAKQFDLQVLTEGEGSDFTVWLYGPRERVELLAEHLKG